MPPSLPPLVLTMGADWEAKTERYLAQCKLQGNRKAIEGHLRTLKTNGAKGSTLWTEARILARLDNGLGEGFEEATREDLETYLADLRSQVPDDNGGWVEGKEPVSEATRMLHKTVIKTFYRHRYSKIFSEVAAWISGGKTSRERLADDILTPAEVRRMVEAAVNERDRALVATLYESGMRLGEFLALRVGSVKDNGDGSADLVLPDGAEGLKTGRRAVPVVECVPYLQRWLESHPLRKEPKAPLWAPLLYGNPREAINDRTMRDALGTMARRAGVTRAVNPHAFRHARATEAARRGWNESQMRAYFGWSRNSTMPSVYTHLANMDVRNKVLEDAGRKPPPKPQESPLAPQDCWYCQERNAATATFCGRCGRPLSVERLQELRRQERILERDHQEALVKGEMQGLLGNPKVQRFLKLIQASELPPPG